MCAGAPHFKHYLANAQADALWADAQIRVRRSPKTWEIGTNPPAYGAAIGWPYRLKNAGISAGRRPNIFHRSLDMRAYMVSVFCECGHAMYQEGKTLVCRFLPCKHYEKLFKAPNVELEPVEDPPEKGEGTE